MRRVLDIILSALLGAGIVLAVLLVARPWQSAIDQHAAEPLDVDDRIIVRWEYPDGTEAMPPEVMPLWEYVWLPQSDLSGRVSRIEAAAGYILTDPEMQGHLERHGMTADERAHVRSALGVE